MTPLEAARRMDDPRDCPQEHGECWFCGWNINRIGSDHAPDCPWLQMPRIVKALEAAERIVSRSSRDGHVAYVEDEDMEMLEAALKGDEPA